MLELKGKDTPAADARRALGPIVFACDESYAMPLATTLRSIAETNAGAWPLEFHVLFSAITQDTRNKLCRSLPKGSASIRWMPVELNVFSEFQTIGHISQVTYARLLIPRVFPASVSKVLYLDADLLVMGALESLWETDLRGAVLGAVTDIGVDQIVKQGGAGRLGVPEVRDYFNAGVLLIDLDRWRQMRISETALDYLARHPRSPYSDQDALNVACDKLWKKLDPRWNFQDHINRRISDLLPEGRPEIVHFATAHKPWNTGLNTELYDEVRRRTLFARTPFEKLLSALRAGWGPLKYLLPLYRVLQHQWRRSLSSGR